MTEKKTNENCPCTNEKCPRRGDCEACQKHHEGREYPSACKREKEEPKKE